MSNRAGKKEVKALPAKQMVLPSSNSGEDVWKAALDTHPDGLAIHSLDGTVLFANKRMLEIYGASIDEIEENGRFDFDQNGLDDCPHERVIESGMSYCAQQPILVAGRYFNLTIHPTRNEGGQVVGSMRIMRDVTDALNLRENLLRAEQFATLGLMVNGIAHDIGTPLNIISGYSEYLLMRFKPDTQGYNEISTILQQTRRIAEYIKQMLDLTRPAQGGADAIVLNSFIRDSIDLISHHLRKYDVKANLSSPANSPTIYSDAPRLRQAFFNLILNACYKLGAGGNLNIVISERDDSSDFVNVSLFGVDTTGKAHDFSSSLKGFVTSDRRQALEYPGLSLAQEIFERIGVRISSYDAGARGNPLVVKLPIHGGNGGDEATPHFNR